MKSEDSFLIAFILSIQFYLHRDRAERREEGQEIRRATDGGERERETGRRETEPRSKIEPSSLIVSERDSTIEVAGKPVEWMITPKQGMMRCPRRISR